MEPSGLNIVTLSQWIAGGPVKSQECYAVGLVSVIERFKKGNDNLRGGLVAPVVANRLSANGEAVVTVGVETPLVLERDLLV
jgi:hypothetical protein